MTRSKRLASKEEVWSLSAISQARKAAKAGATVDELRQILGSSFSDDSFRKKLKREFGIVVDSRPLAHNGSSRLTYGGRDQMPLNRSEA